MLLRSLREHPRHPGDDEKAAEISGGLRRQSFVAYRTGSLPGSARSPPATRSSRATAARCIRRRAANRSCASAT
jgi:hypothetical protein